MSKYTNARISRDVDMHSNGETAIKFFFDQIANDALYLLDEPENSLSVEFQMKLAEYIEASVTGYSCQFVISTHSPILLAMKGAKIYDLDETPVITKPWTELRNVLLWKKFFDSRKEEFDKLKD